MIQLVMLLSCWTLITKGGSAIGKSADVSLYAGTVAPADFLTSIQWRVWAFYMAHAE
jgi:hypothetical protein